LKPIIPRIAEDVLDCLFVDLVGTILPISLRGYEYIMVMTDERSKWADATPLITKTAEEVVGAISSLLFAMYGIDHHTS